MTIAAIETRYAGCRFRSRLEARWAVFFDHLGITWRYEDQGYLVGAEGHELPYLPDFYLPTEHLWIEVKGDLQETDRNLITQAAITHWGLPTPAGSTSLIVLGDVPRPVGRPIHSALYFRKGDVYRVWAEFMPGWITRHDAYEDIVGNDSWDCFRVSPDLNVTGYFKGSSDPNVLDAYKAARSARFEHGERG